METDLSVIGVLELNSIAVGIKALDGMVKAAPIKVLEVKIINPGKYVIIITGDVASVDASLTAGKEIGEEALVDSLFIPNLHRDIIPALTGSADRSVHNALGIVESFSAAAGIEAGDTAAKEADVKITEIKIGDEMGGKSFVRMIGEIGEVEAAVKAGSAVIKNKGMLYKDIIIPNPHEEIKPFL